MSVRASVVAPGWICANIGLACGLFAFDESLFAELLYLLAAVPALAFAFAVWRSEVATHGDLRTLRSGTWNAVWLAAGWTLLGVGAIYLTWIWVVGAVISLVAAFRLWRSRPVSIDATAAQLARLPVVVPHAADLETTPEQSPEQAQVPSEHATPTRPRAVVRATAAIAAWAVLRRVLRPSDRRVG